MRDHARHAALCAALAASFAASASDYKLEYDRKVKNAQNVGVLGDDLAGDVVNFNNGALMLHATDVSLPTNGLTLTLDRSYNPELDAGDAAVKAPIDTGEREILSPRMYAFASWDLNVPRITTVMEKDVGWTLSSSTPNQRCSVVGQTDEFGQISTARPPTASGTRGWPFSPERYWNGYTLRVGKSEQPLLVASLPNAERPSTGGPYHWTTTGDWWISCLPGLAGPKDTNGNVRVPGEGFLARSPDGTTYTFNWMSKRIVNSATDFDAEIQTKNGPYPRPQYLFRSEYTMLPTRIEDRFGNWITYTWTNDDFARLDRIDAGHAGSTVPVQTIDVTLFTPEGYIKEVRVKVEGEDDRIWSYDYDGPMLSKVTLPDGKSWQYMLGLEGFRADDYRPVCTLDEQITDPNIRFWECWGGGDVPDIGWAGYVIHPSGAKIEFGMGPNFRLDNLSHITHPIGLQWKRITGPGMAERFWRFSYLPSKTEARDACRYATCPSTNLTDQINPDGSVVRRIYGLDTRQYGELTGSIAPNGGGSPVVTSTAWYSGVVNKPTPTTGTTPYWYAERETKYLSEGAATFTARVGVHPYSYVTAPDPTYLSQRRLPLQQVISKQQDVVFNIQHTGYDAFGRAVATTESSTGSAGSDFARYLTRSYYDDASKWVVGQLRTTGCKTTSDCSGAAGREISRTDYYASTALPWKTFRYGQQQNEFTYASNGLLASVKDGRNNSIGLSNWEYGVPKNIAFPTVPATSMSATPHKLGWIKSVTDEMTFATNFGYDLVGRLTSIAYPTGDPIAWNSLGRTVTVATSAAYGLPIGHWQQQVTTGTGRTTTYYDGQLRPVLVLTEDTADATTRSFVVSRFDSMGRKVFQSYPVGSLAAVDDATLKGVRTYYDALGRVTRVQQDSESVNGVSVLNTDTSYLSGFKTEVKNPRGFTTTTRYQLFGEPSTDAPTLIELPEGVSTAITRQPALGKPVTVTRSGAFGASTLAATRSYVYDSLERLCQTIEPESGTTIVTYDGNDNIAWSADGQVATGTSAASCENDRSTTAAADKVSRTYDEMNRELTRTTTAGTSNITSTYFADGKLKSLVATNPGGNTVTTTYSYNNRRLLTGEILQVNSLTPWTTAYAYNANGHLSTQTYPGNMTIGYAPDGLGRPTQAGTFATEVKYYPNGAMSSFKYGNGIVHTMTQNARLLPANSKDVVKDALGNVTAVILDDSYTYDANGNVLSLLDASNAPATDKRSWGTPNPVANPTLVTQYDGLDRLLKVYNPNWGTPPTGVHNAVYSYDPLDNLRSNRLGASELTYGYNSKNQLASLSYNSGAAQAVTTNARGDITANAYRGQAYQFDLSHRLSEVSGKESYLYDGNGRRARTLNLQTGTIEYFGYSLDGRLMQDWSNRRQVRNGYVYLGNTLVGLYEVNITNGAINPRYKHTDALGSPVVTTDAGKNVMSRMAYTPYGAPTAPMDGVGYTGHFIDVGTQLTYMQQRHYDPQVGRFLSADPIAMSADSGDEFNRFAYAASNPFRFVDPDGRLPLDRIEVKGKRQSGTIVIEMPPLERPIPQVRPVAAPVVLPPPWYLAPLLYFWPSELGAQPCEMNGGPRCGPVYSEEAWPAGTWPGDEGAKEWGRRQPGVGAQEGKRRFHGIKQKDKGQGGGKGRDKYGVNPSTGEVYNPQGEAVGNLGDKEV